MQLADTAGATIDATLAKLPNDFPKEMAEQIGAGAKRRLNSLAIAESGA